MFMSQLATLEKIEEDDGRDCAVKTQHIKWRASNDQLYLKAYGRTNVANCYLTTSDIGSLVIAVVELRCLDVGHSPSTFSRTYWIETYSLRAFTGDKTDDTEYVQDIIKQCSMLTPRVDICS
ncbi:hypothetical protein BYT27DRAFT_7195720 [Phlegmacium glaucopus]|nr:hypothetical protein BYT27DRAFT_7195720 [Phlegmacium glaucopus]